MDLPVGLIGIGEMGLPMARNLIRAGYPVFVLDTNPEPVGILEKEGARVAGSPEEMARNARFIMVIVRTPAQVKQVILGDHGILTGARPDDAVAVMSTIDPVLMMGLAEKAGDQGVHMLDAPVSGARQRAESGDLTIMIGGSREVFETHKPVFRVMGRELYYMGGAGSGQCAKLINNLLLLIHMCAAHEAKALAESLDLDLDKLFGLIKESTGNSWIIENWDVVAAWKDQYVEGGTLDLLYKDINLTLALAESKRVPVHLSSLAKQLVRY